MKASHEEMMAEMKFSHQQDGCVARKNKGLPRSVWGQEPREAKSNTDLEEMDTTDFEANWEKSKTIMMRQEVPNKEAAVETTGALEDWSGNQQMTMGYQNPQKRRAKDDDVQKAPNGQIFRKRGWVQPKCSNGIRS
jgi:hypothetical protein